MKHGILLTLIALCTVAYSQSYDARVLQVRRTPGFVALWDFVKRDPSGARFDAHLGLHERADLSLDAANYVLDYWGQGRKARYTDFPLRGSGPFGQAVQFRAEKEHDFRPLLFVPRERLHNSGLDAKGPRRSVSMVVWLIRESGNHAIAGIWHEGTDLHSASSPVAKVERGKRQYCLFAGLAANNGASAVHVSENGAASFGDRYARHLAVTAQVIPANPPGTWSVAAFTFDNDRNTVTAYLNGKADEYWIDHPEQHPFFQWPAKGWRSGEWAPPEAKPLKREVLEQRPDGQIVELHTYLYTRVRVTRKGRDILKRDLVALRGNPFWFPHDLYSPARESDGGPFTIGRVIHTSRSVGFTGWIGGVAVFDRALSAKDHKRLAAIAESGPIKAPTP